MNGTGVYTVEGVGYRVSYIFGGDNRYRGRITVLGREATGQLIGKPIIIDTPASFSTVKAAMIEAHAYCREIINNWALDDLTFIDKV